jgi:hypothetical protein
MSIKIAHSEGTQVFSNPLIEVRICSPSEFLISKTVQMYPEDCITILSPTLNLIIKIFLDYKLITLFKNCIDLTRQYPEDFYTKKLSLPISIFKTERKTQAPFGQGIDNFVDIPFNNIILIDLKFY